MRYKALVFDFFGVVCTEVGSPWFVEHQLGGEAFKDMYVHPADTGEETQEELFDELGKLSGMRPRDIEVEWEGRAHFNTELLQQIDVWRRQCKIGLLSNAPLPFFRTLVARGDIERHFDATVVSSEIGHAKPDPAMYLAILEKLGVTPGEALMIDDREENVTGAIKVGMGGHLFTSVAGLKEKLEKPGELPR